MDVSTMAGLLQPFLRGNSLPPVALQQLRQHLDLLLRWNARVNLTAVRDAENIVSRHFGESLFLASRLFPAPAQPDRGPGPLSRGLDLGSGAGFPGLPLKIYAPGTRLTLVESIHKKCAFLREVIRSLALHDVDVFSGRAERLAPEPPPQALAGFPPSLVTLRAVEHFEQVVRTASALVDPGGTLALLIGADQARLVPAVVPAFAWSDAESIPLSERRVILLGKKQGSNESKL